MRALFSALHQLRPVLVATLAHHKTGSGRSMSTLESLPFDNSVLRALPLDSEERSYVRTVQGTDHAAWRCVADIYNHFLCTCVAIWAGLECAWRGRDWIGSP